MPPRQPEVTNRHPCTNYRAGAAVRAYRGIAKLTVAGGWARVGEADRMTPEPSSYRRHRFPGEIIRHAVWLYHAFSLSLRDVELILAERGVVVTHESIRNWCQKFGAEFAQRLRRRRPRPGNTWHLDEVFIRIRGVLHYLWRAVDQHGVVLDILVQAKRDGAATRFFKRLLQGLQDKPKRLITDGLRSAPSCLMSNTGPAAI
jgi:putative transposase